MRSANDLLSLPRPSTQAAEGLHVVSFGQRAAHCVLVLLVLVWFGLEVRAESARPSSGGAQPVPFAGSLPRAPLPAGDFAGWCGTDDAFLMREAPGFSKYRLHHRDGTEIATITIEPGREGFNPGCDERAENIVFASSFKEILGFNRTNNRTTVLLSYKSARDALPAISLAPNLRYVAYKGDGSRPGSTHPGEWTTHLDLERFEVNGQFIRWKNDSSMLFSTDNPTPTTNYREYVQTITVVHAASRQAKSGRLPRGYHVWDGAFINDGSELLLFLKPSSDDSAHGTIFRCRVPGIKCRQVVANVERVSMNESGDIGTTSWVFDRPRPKPNSDAVYLPDRYVVRVLDANAKAVRVAEFPGKAVFEPRAEISPSGKLMAVTWLPLESQCAWGRDAGVCNRGVLINLKR